MAAIRHGGVTWAIALVLLGSALGLFSITLVLTTNELQSVQDGIVARCESNNEVLEGLRSEKNREIEFARHLPRLFEAAGVDPKYIEDYANKQIALIKSNRDNIFKEHKC